jgi:hypothetical protein
MNYVTKAVLKKCPEGINEMFHVISNDNQRRRNIDNWGVGADIHIFVFTDCKNNRFQKKLIGQNTNIRISAPQLSIFRRL